MQRDNAATLVAIFCALLSTNSRIVQADDGAPRLLANVTPYVDYGWIRSEDNRPLAKSVTRSQQVTGGIDFNVDPALRLGAGFTYGVGNSDYKDLLIPGEADNESITGFGRATYSFLQNYNIGVIGGYGGSWTDEFRIAKTARITSERDAATSFVGVNAGAAYDLGNFFVAPSARVFFSSTDNRSFTYSTGASVPGFTDTLGRSSFGGDIGYRALMGTTWVIPYVRAFYVYDFDLLKDQHDRSAFDLSAGINLSSGSLSGGAEFLSTVGRDDQESIGGRAFLLYSF